MSSQANAELGGTKGSKAGSPCVVYIGPGGSGHYVKMVN